MSAYSPRPEDFAPLGAQNAAPVLVRPSLSYWADARARLLRNPRALGSLVLLALLGLFTTVGPLFWTVDPSTQNLDRISEPPNLGAEALLIDRSQRWPGIEAEGWPAAPDPFWLQSPTRAALPAPEGLEVIGTPHTWSVRLRWSPVENAAGYRIYRNRYQPTALNELGLPLGDRWSGAEVSYEDALALEPGVYWYSVTATDGLRESPQFQTLRVDVERALPLNTARKARLLAPEDGAPGERLTLPAHPLGTDYLGRDMLSRLMHGARTSLFIGLLAPLLYVLFGTAYGAAAGFLGGRADAVLMRLADFVVALPFLLFMILFRVA
ncbi:MAG: hypothetical protein ACPGC1_06795, partial [Pseudomonadales bacterium]